MYAQASLEGNPLADPRTIVIKINQPTFAYSFIIFLLILLAAIQKSDRKFDSENLNNIARSITNQNYNMIRLRDEIEVRAQREDTVKRFRDFLQEFRAEVLEMVKLLVANAEHDMVRREKERRLAERARATERMKRAECSSSEGSANASVTVAEQQQQQQQRPREKKPKTQVVDPVETPLSPRGVRKDKSATVESSSGPNSQSSTDIDLKPKPVKYRRHHGPDVREPTVCFSSSSTEAINLPDVPKNRSGSSKWNTTTEKGSEKKKPLGGRRRDEEGESILDVWEALSDPVLLCRSAGGC